VSASDNLPLHYKVQFSSGSGSQGWSRKKGREMVVVLSSSSDMFVEVNGM